MLKIKRALISVSDKTGIVDLAKVLVSFGVEIISTGGTARALKDAGVPVVEMSDYTGFPEMLDGRVKTLHPKIHGGLLARRDDPAHMKQAQERGIGLIDMVVVNLYPFEKTVAKDGVSFEEAIENIDIGGPSMLRSAAKNHASVAVVCGPRRYPSVIQALKDNNGGFPEPLLSELAAEVFDTTARYDAAIARYLQGRGGPVPGRGSLGPALNISLSRAASLRYGENPHQAAGLYRFNGSESAPTLVSALQLHGKELSFNNYLDLNAVLENVRGFAGPCACIVKHTNPTGVALAKTPQRAFLDAWQSDPLSAFGGIVGFNRFVDVATARALVRSGFLECILAPGYDAEALVLLKGRKNLRLLQMPVGETADPNALDFKRIDGGFLLQDRDAHDVERKDIKIVTRKKPTPKEMTALLFAWEVVRHVKSNAIVLARGTKTVGIGMGQTSRVDSVYMAVKRAGKRSLGAVLASDGFFPKPDNIALAKKAGIKAVIQPGGSIADQEIIRAADKARMAMVFTGVRHFKH
ncbi:MAG: bifunctional phosphoribosylaminoimidazolecarboxamide formyltransferase/IMP cyclohydrolase [Candidatus Omnitrophica bacterium]|nr:bifunctional phosphoribosylaminoimidazolecarboxamide formyltransferase/IMP cyclohydrolase [Candidatus Omnitrophota bacterium]